MKKVWAVYFSATGTTKKTACHLAGNMAKDFNVPMEEFDFTYLENREKEIIFTEDDFVFLATPVIAGRVPNLLLKYLSSIRGNNALGAAVVLYGNRNYDDALIELKEIMHNCNFNVIGCGAFVGEHSFSKTLGANRPDSEDLNEMNTFSKALKEKLLNKDFSGEFFVKGNNPPSPYYTPRDRMGNGIDIRKVKPKTNDKCINCGLCAEICPLQSISHYDNKTIEGICMKCCGCVKRCPVQAKYFDDEGYLYHKQELESMYGDKRNINQWFL